MMNRSLDTLRLVLSAAVTAALLGVVALGDVVPTDARVAILGAIAGYWLRETGHQVSEYRNGRSSEAVE